MATTDKTGIQASITAGIRTGASDTTAADLRAILNEILDSYANVIDGGGVYQSPVGYNYLPTTLGASNFINRDYADNRYASVSVGLGDVLAQSNHTNNIDITSLDTSSVLSIIDGMSKMYYSAHGNFGKVQIDDNGSVMDWSDGVVVAAITHSVADTTYAHNVKNRFVSPVNDFGTIQIYSGRVQLSTSNRVTWSSTLGGSPYIVGTTSVTSKSINIDATHNSSSYTRLIQVASTTQAYISIQSNIIAAWPISEVRVDGFNKSVLIDAPDVINIGTTNSTIINYGNASTVHNFLGTAIYELQVNSYVQDKLMTLNYGGSVGSGIGVGYEIEENAIITGYQKTNAGRDGWSFKAPANTSYTDIVFSSTTPRIKTFQDSTSTIAEYANKLNVFSPTTSAELATVISDETGTGSLVFANAPTLVNPIVGTQTANDNSTKAASTAYTDAADALKLPIEVPSTTGVALTFETDRVYGSIGTPETGNITYSSTNAKLGVTNIIIHNHTSAPTFGTNMKKLSGSGSYVTSAINYIYVTYINSTEVIYAINQRT